MRVLLACLHFGLIRNFESVVAELANRGHEVVLASEERDTLGGDEVADLMASGLSGVRIIRVPAVLDEASVDLGQRLRLVLDNLRFHSQDFREFAKLRERMTARLPYVAQCVDLTRVPGARRAVAQVERALPVSPRLRAWLNEERPDVVLLASLTHPRSIQPDLLRAAILEKIPSVACVYSWDHLSSKAHIIDVPDRIFVWNDAQRSEAVRLHGLPAERVTTTGAQCYDQWFDSRPTRDRDTFCRSLGLDPSRPYVLYTCSALTPSPNEPAFVMEWMACLRGSSQPLLRDLGVLLRPHPERLREWAGVDYAQFEHVAFRPRTGDADQAKRDYLDALHHSAAVVGVVTSAFLEAAIIGRPVLTPMLPVFAPHQWGTQHFRYLLEVEQGLPIVGRTLDEHVRQLEDVLSGRLAWRERQERFLATFVRAGQLTRPATPQFVDAVEQVGAKPSHARRREPSVMARVAAPLVLAIARSPRVRPWLQDDSERENDRRQSWEGEIRIQKATARDARYDQKDRLRQERMRRRREKKAELKLERYRLKARERDRRLEQQRARKARLKRGRYRARIYTIGQRVAGRVRRVLGWSPEAKAAPPKTPKTPEIQS